MSSGVTLDSLPDDLCSHILSKVPLLDRCAMQTTVGCSSARYPQLAKGGNPRAPPPAPLLAAGTVAQRS